MEFQAVVLAAGPGSGLMDLTRKKPKALLPIANLPMVWYPVHLLEKAGFKEAIVVVLESQEADIRTELVEVCDVKIQLTFVSIADNVDWGTADSLRHIKDLVKTDLLVVSCDLVTDLSLHLLADLHRKYDASLTMLLAQSPDVTNITVPGGKEYKQVQAVRDLVGLDEDGSRLLCLSSVADLGETMTLRESLLRRQPYIQMRSDLTDGHLYLMKRWVLDYLCQETSITTFKELLPHLIKKQFLQPKDDDPHLSSDVTMEAPNEKREIDLYSLAEEDPMTKLAREMSTYNDHRGDLQGCFHGDKVRCYGYVMEGGFCLRANTMLTYCEANRQVPKQLLATWTGQEGKQEIPLIHPAATLAQKSHVSPDSLVGDGAAISEKTTVKRSIIGKHCTIGKKVIIQNSILMNHVVVEDGCTLTGCVVGENACISERAELKDSMVGIRQHVIALGKLNNEVLRDYDAE